jgi:4-hydroxy 2-oxovalerate aldolase
VAERFGVDPRDLIVEVGRLQAVAGQEDLLIEIAARLAAAGRSPSAG